MYRLLIVDDEPTIVEGMYQLFIESCSFELDVCKAYSGVEAVRILKETKVDIILSDIRMPGITGLQLLEKVSLYWPSCRVVFLTGYSEFDYVYAAIKKPGVKYILKIEGDDVILKAVEDALSEIEKEAKQKTFLDNAKEQRDIMLSSLKKEFIKNLIAGDIISDDLMRERFKELDVRLIEDTPLVIIIGKIDYLPQGRSYSDSVQTLSDICNIFNNFVGSYALLENIIYGDSIAAFLIQPDLTKKYFINNENRGREEFIPYLKASIENIQNTIKDKLALTVSFAVSNKYINMEELKAKFDALRELMDKFLAAGHEMMIIDDESRVDEKVREIDNTIERLHEFINENLDKDLSLTRIAKHVYLNPSYLSRFYKKYTKRNLSDYINEVRLAKAKELLMNTDLKINEIARKVGLESPSYFTLVLKRYTGSTPQDYRDMLLRNK